MVCGWHDLLTHTGCLISMLHTQTVNFYYFSLKQVKDFFHWKKSWLCLKLQHPHLYSSSHTLFLDSTEMDLRRVSGVYVWKQRVLKVD